MSNRRHRAWEWSDHTPTVEDAPGTSVGATGKPAGFSSATTTGGMEVALPASKATAINNSNLCITILRTFFEREGLTTEATNWLNVVIESHSHLNR